MSLTLILFEISFNYKPIMFREETDLVNFAEKHKINVSINDEFVQNHPLTGEKATYWSLRISRGRKSFLIVRNKESFSFDDENGFYTREELIAEVLTSLPKFEPLSFEDYYRNCCGEGENDDFPREKVKEWHETETWEFNQVLRLFPDILEELKEII